MTWDFLIKKYCKLMTENTKSKDLYAVWLGESGFPYGMAAIQKVIILGDALTREGVHFTVINRKGVFEPGQHTDLQPVGDFQGMKYIYASGTIHRPKGFFVRNLMKVKGAVREFLYLRSMHAEDKLDGAFVSSMSFLQTLLYRIYGKLFSFPVILLYAEMSSAMQHRSGVVRRVNDYFFDNFLVRWMSGTLPISELLVDNYKKIAPGKLFLKIPAICRFENFNVPRKKLQERYFLFCGAFDYREVINFIIEAYQKVDHATNYKLYLIVSGGSPTQYKEFNQYLKDRELLDKTKVFSNIPFSELVDHYVNAAALLIPLRPTIQDIARFPHKISEYTATGNPIISTNYGEVKHYFTDGENALIAKTYDTSQFAEKMKYVAEYPEQAKKIGLNGKELGMKYFNHLQYGPLLKDYIKHFIAKKN